MPKFVLAVLTMSVAASSSVAYSQGGFLLVTEPSKGMPACEEFYDKWEVQGAPSGMMAMMGFSREVFAAKDCLSNNNVAMACKHWQGLLVASDKFGPPLSDNRGDVEEMMRQHQCELGATPEK